MGQASHTAGGPPRRGEDRRSFLRAGAVAFVAGLWQHDQLPGAYDYSSSRSKPSDLKITDLRACTIKVGSAVVPLIRIDTNQGISGLGELRDGSHKNYALMLKRLLLGENPCNVDRLFRKIKQFGSHARQAGGVCGVEMALWDLAGKAYGVPTYQLLGGKFRDKVRLYADTPEVPEPKECARRLKARMERGFTFLKMDLGVGLIENVSGAVTRPLGMSSRDVRTTQHVFTGFELTDRGVAMLADYVAEVRAAIGMDVPLAADHFGHVGVNSCIRLGRALERYNLAWLEDMIPWQFADLLKKITDAVDTPTLTGEDIYLKEDFRSLCEQHAVDIVHPDLATAGGLLETKKIGDLAMEHGVPMAMHFAGGPIGCLASVHCAAATENFLALEFHGVDVPGWEDLVTGIGKPIVDRGYIAVPDTPGLGVALNDEAVRRHLVEPGYFEPTQEWDNVRTNDRLWS